MERGFLSQKGSGVGRGVKVKRVSNGSNLEDYWLWWNGAWVLSQKRSRGGRGVKKKSLNRNLINTSLGIGVSTESDDTMKEDTPVGVASVVQEGVTPSVVDMTVDMGKLNCLDDTTILESFPPLSTPVDSAGNAPGKSLYANITSKPSGNKVKLTQKKWHPDENLLKEDVSIVLVWVKLHGVPVMTFSKDGLSAIATKLDNIVIAMPKITREGHYTCNVRVEYEWKPPRCSSCKVFGHIHEECLKNTGAGFKPQKEYRPVTKKPNASSSGNKEKCVEPSIEVSNSNPFDVLNLVDSDREFGINGGTTILVNNGATSSRSSFMNIDSDGEFASNIPIGNVERDSEVEVVFDETVNLIISTSGKDGSDKEVVKDGVIPSVTVTCVNSQKDLNDDPMAMEVQILLVDQTNAVKIGNGIDVVVPVESIRAIAKDLNTWGKFGLVKSMLNSSTGLFSFQRSSTDGLNSMLENGPWFIRNHSLILFKWNSNVDLLKNNVGNVLVWVKIHGVPVTAFSEDGLNAITTKLGTPLMLDSYTSDMCLQSWGRSSYARVMIELQADVELKDNIMEVCPKNIGLGVTKNLKKPSQTSRGVPVDLKVGFKPHKEYTPIPKKPTASPSGNKKKVVAHTNKVNNGAYLSGSSFMNVKNSSTSNTPIIDKIRMFEDLIIDRQAILVDEADNSLKKVEYPGDYDSEDEVASVDNDMTRSLALEMVGFGTQSLLEQEMDSYGNGDFDEDPYDDMYEGQDLPQVIQAICDNLDI
nr:hypothetical protein [Tanacetum cinerariifolium]